MRPAETKASVRSAEIHRWNQGQIEALQDAVAVEEPLEIQLAFGAAGARKVKSISITMRTPGHDEELAAGFLMTEGVVRDATDIASIRAGGPKSQAICVELLPGIEVNMSSLERNFYTTSSCGVCGKASLLALRTVCPLPQCDDFTIPSNVLSALPRDLHTAQAAFLETGGLHAASLFSSDGQLQAVREDVGRHNALDKLLGEAFLRDAVPLRDYLLLLSGRASFELLQKAVMGGIPMVAAIGAPSSLAIEVAREFSVTLVGFLRSGSFNVYSAPQRIVELQKVTAPVNSI